MSIGLHGFFSKIFLFSADEQIAPAGPLLTGTFSVFSLKHFNSTALHINLLIYLRVSAQLKTIFYARSQRRGRSRTMLCCTADVYILLLDSGLHLLHAPFRPKKRNTLRSSIVSLERKNTEMMEKYSGFHLRWVGGGRRSVVFEMRTTEL